MGRARTAGKAMGTWEDFLKATSEKRTDFYRHSHDAMGKELKALITETISESIAEKEMESWIKDGKFLDLEDMTKKYKDKPDQLESILLRTRTHFCEVRNTNLYEDPEYMSKKSSTLETSKDSKRQISAERISKPAKVVKRTAEETEAEVLSLGQIKMLTKEAAALQTPESNLQELLEQAEEERLAPMIAAPVLAKLKLAIASLAGQRTLIDLMVENKKGDVAGILKDIKEAKGEALATAKIMRAQLVVAKSLAPAAEAPAAERRPTAPTLEPLPPNAD